jgi:hypothetical protein
MVGIRHEQPFVETMTTGRNETGRHVRTQEGEKLVGVSAVPMHLKREVESTSLHGG